MNGRKRMNGQGDTMSSEQGLGRRDFLRRGVVLTFAAGAGTVAGGTIMAQAVSGGFSPGSGLAQLSPLSDSIDYDNMYSLRLMATDGWFSFPGRRHSGTPVYGFGFRAPDNLDLVAAGGELDANPGDLISKYKGKVLQTAPTIVAVEGQELAIVLTNLGFEGRPDLADAHSLHWHGFRNATAVFDGVPETSLSVPSGRDLPYFFDPKTADELGQSKGSAGTYMYHCHFEDTEHVQMGMVGVVFIEPRDMYFEADGVTPLAVRRKVAYNDNPAGVDSSFDREFALLINEVDTRPHDLLEAVQGFVWSDYDPNYWTINGRSYPDTVIPQITPVEQAVGYSEPFTMPTNPTAGTDRAAEAEMLGQHNSSLIQCKAGENVLLRIASLGYEIHSLDFVGIGDPKVIAHDASLLIGRDGTSDLTYTTRRVELGPGEARDIIFEAPAYDDAAAVDDVLADQTTGVVRRFNRYLLKTRNHDRLSNDGGVFADGPSYAGASGTYGGMVTEIWVYPDDAEAATLGHAPLPPQNYANETFPTLVVPAGHV